MKNASFARYTPSVLEARPGRAIKYSIFVDNSIQHLM